MKVLFVCTGNTCRSPMAAAILSKHRIPGVDVASVGIYAVDHSPASAHVQTLWKDNEIEYQHESKRLTISDLNEASLILTMTNGHKQAILADYPEARSKVFTLNEYVNGNAQDVQDPYGGSLAVYEDTYAVLEQLIEQLVEKLALENNKQR